MMLTLSEKFFAQFPAGDRTLTFLVGDEDGRSTEKTSVVRTQGVVSYTATDSWNDKAELKAYVFDTSASDVKVRYRRKGVAEWSETPGLAERRARGLQSYGDGHRRRIRIRMPALLRREGDKPTLWFLDGGGASGSQCRIRGVVGFQPAAALCHRAVLGFGQSRIVDDEQERDAKRWQTRAPALRVPRLPS